MTPVSGITRVTPPMITNAWTPRIVASPAANSCENGRFDWIAMRNALPTRSRKPPMTATVPISPSSSPMAEKMKSVVATGITLGLPSPRPVPVKPAGAEREQALGELVPVVLRIGPRVEPGGHALLHVAERLVRERRRAPANRIAPLSRYAARCVAM